MKVFITGGTGLVGSKVVKELLDQNNSVSVLTRSQDAKKKVEQLGATAIIGEINNIAVLKKCADMADAVIHMAYSRIPNDPLEAARIDRIAIDTMGQTMVGTGKILIVTSGVPTNKDGHIVTEKDMLSPKFPRKSEEVAMKYADKGVRVSIVRPSRLVHGISDIHGFIPQIISISKKASVVYYIGDGQNNMHAVNAADLAHLYVLVLEKGVNRGIYQGVGESSVPYKEIAEVIGSRLKLPVKSLTMEQGNTLLGFVGTVIGTNNPASSEQTQKEHEWEPTHAPLIEDLKENYNWLM